MPVMGRGRVLIVEDDADLREMMCLLLAHEGFEAEAVGDGAAALDRLRSAAPRPQLILLDLMMPRMDGWQFCREKASDPSLADIPVIVLSAVRRERTEEFAAMVLPKPLDFEALLSAVRSHCGNAA
jgi:CheY-like chemotaxis protein